MVKLYKEDDKGNLLYMETWSTESFRAIVHKGKVGREGSDEEIEMNKFDKAIKTESDYFKYFTDKYKKEGYLEIPDEKLVWLVVQFPMKSLKGNKRDHWLRDKVTEYLNEELGWRGLGHVDGFDMGKQIADHKKFALNIFCEVVDEAKGIAAIKRCLREYRLDYTRIKIASRPYLSDGGFQLKYSAKKKDQTFSL